MFYNSLANGVFCGIIMDVDVDHDDQNQLNLIMKINYALIGLEWREK